MTRRAWGWSARDKRRKPQLARPTPADALYGTHMKRHAALIPLSHDHHDILVIAQGLILGRSKAPRSTWPTDKQAQADRVVLFFAQLTVRQNGESTDSAAGSFSKIKIVTLGIQSSFIGKL